MPEFQNVEHYYDFIKSQFERYNYELSQVHDNWCKEYGKVPFSSYVPVFAYFLRTNTRLDMSLVSIKSKGKSVIITILPPKNYPDFPNIVITYDKEGTRVQSFTYRTMTPEEREQKRAEDFLKHCKRHGLQERDLGREFNLGPKRYKIVSCKERKQTYGIVCFEFTRGKLVDVRTTSVVQALKEQDDG